MSDYLLRTCGPEVTDPQKLTLWVGTEVSNQIWTPVPGTNDRNTKPPVTGNLRAHGSGS